ncbi:MAG: hypothetical protein KJ000_15225 [Pirellulaceae bacterium]|nr:hypothetical protein [Pirellulaceae bacterium]
MWIQIEPRGFFRNGVVSWLAIACLAVLTVASGCSGGSDAGAQATGVVTIDGAPAANVLVNFLPTEGGNSAFATTDANGRFTVQTTRTVGGLAPGEYRVTVHPGDEDSGRTVASVPEKYQSERSSDLRVSVGEGVKNDLKIELSSSR